MVGIEKLPKAFSVSFQDLTLWNVGAQFKAKWGWPSEVLKPLSDVLVRRIDPLENNTSPNFLVTLLTIHFDGSIETRNPVPRKTIKGKLFKVFPGDVVFSKIDVRNGAIALVPEGIENCCVTSEFPAYSVNSELSVPQYIKLLFRSKVFMRILNSMISGASGRKRIQPSQLESVRIPIPSIPIQQKIIGHWETSHKEVSNTNQLFSELVYDLNQTLIQNTFAYRRLKNSRVFAASYSKAQKWDLKAGRSAAFQTANPEFVRLGAFTEECTELVRPWEDPKKEWPIYGVNNKDGVFLNTYQKGKNFNAPYKRIEKNWFFHNPTRANVGSLGIVPEVPDDAITSPEYQVWRLHSGFLPDFMALMIRTEYFLFLVDFNRVGGVKQRMYYANLAEIRLPMIDIETQNKFADQRAVILSSITKANETIKERKSEIEEMIIGLRPVEGI